MRFPRGLLCLAFAAACSDVTVPARIFVSMVPSGVHSAREDGNPLNLTRWDFDPRVGLTRGYWIVKSEHEWRDLWPNTDADRIPLLPEGIDFGREMLIVAAPTDEGATGARIHQAIDTPESGVHIYVSQVLPGLGCPPGEGGKTEKVPVDLARIPALDKEIHFHVDTKNETPCSPPSEAKIGCRSEGAPEGYLDKLTVEPGKRVTCVSEGKLGSRAMVDRTWSFQSVPPGATPKMTVTEGGAGINFGTDAYGTYSVALDITDDLGRVSRTTSDVTVAPPKDALVVQMLWTRFQPEDDPSTFPRVELHIVGDKPPPPPPPGHSLPPLASRSQPWILVHGDCVLGGQKPPAWCKARTLAATTVVELPIDAFPLYRIGVRYGDDRYAGQPVLCVRTFRGALATEWCDDKVRSEGNWWDVGTVDAVTGKLPAPPAPPPSASASVAPASSGSSAPPPTPPSSSSSAAPKPPPPAAPKPAASAAPPAAPKPKATPDPWTP